MHTTIRSEAIGNWELRVIGITHPNEPAPLGYLFKARLSLGNGRFTNEISDNSRGFQNADEAWQAGLDFIAKQ